MRCKIFICLLIMACWTNVHAQNTKDYYITPERFGCVGDSITDDADNMQKAIDYCKAHNRILRSSKGKIYAISHPLDLTTPHEMQIDFGGAEIKAIKSMDYMMKYDNHLDFNIRHNNIINNIVFECNNMSGGIYCATAIKTSFNFIMIRNCSGKAFDYEDGYEVIFTNSHIHCNEGENTYGLYLKSGDSHFDNVVIIDAHTAIYQKIPSVNFFDKIHAWMYHHVAGTAFLHLAGGMAIVQEGYCDTFEKGYYIDSPSSFLRLMGGQYYNNPECYDSAVRPIIFAYDSQEQAKRKSITCTNCHFSAGMKCDFCNYPVHRVQLLQCLFVPDVLGNRGELPLTAVKGITFNRSLVNIADNTNVLNSDIDNINHLYVDANVESYEKDKNVLDVAILPKAFFPTKPTYGICVIVWNDGTCSNGCVEVNGNDGVIHVTCGDKKWKKTVKRVVIDMNYN
jgi:hypothetical protein